MKFSGSVGFGVQKSWLTFAKICSTGISSCISSDNGSLRCNSSSQCHYSLASFIFSSIQFTSTPVWGTGIRGLMRGMTTLNETKAIIGQRQSLKTPGELGVRKSTKCDIFPFRIWQHWLGNRKGIRPVKRWVLVCWWWWFDWSFARLIAVVVTATSIILSFNKTS